MNHKPNKYRLIYWSHHVSGRRINDTYILMEAWSAEDAIVQFELQMKGNQPPHILKRVEPYYEMIE